MASPLPGRGLRHPGRDLRQHGLPLLTQELDPCKFLSHLRPEGRANEGIVQLIFVETRQVSDDDLAWLAIRPATLHQLRDVQRVVEVTLGNLRSAKPDLVLLDFIPYSMMPSSLSPRWPQAMTFRNCR